MEKVLNTFLVAFFSIILLVGCGSDSVAHKTETVDNKENVQTEKLTDENIPSLDEIIAEGTNKYDAVELSVDGYNDLAEHYNVISEEFNKAAGIYSKEDVAQNDDIENKMTAISGEMEEIMESVKKAQNYGDAIEIVKKISAIKKELSEAAEMIESK